MCGASGTEQTPEWEYDGESGRTTHNGIEWDIDANLPMYTRDYLRLGVARQYQGVGGDSLFEGNPNYWACGNCGAIHHTRISYPHCGICGMSVGESAVDEQQVTQNGTDVPGLRREGKYPWGASQNGTDAADIVEHMRYRDIVERRAYELGVEETERRIRDAVREVLVEEGVVPGPDGFVHPPTQSKRGK